MHRTLPLAALLFTTPSWAAPALDPVWQALAATPELRTLQITQNVCAGAMQTWLLVRTEDQGRVCRLGPQSVCEATTVVKLDQRAVCQRSIQTPVDPGWATPIVQALSADRPLITSARTLTPKRGPAVIFASQPTVAHRGAWWMAVRTPGGWKGGALPVEAEAQSMFSDDGVIVNTAGSEPAWGVIYSTARVASGGGVHHRRLVFVQSNGQQWATQRTVGVYAYAWDAIAKQALSERGELRDPHARDHMDVQLTPTFTPAGHLKLDLAARSQRDLEEPEAQRLLDDVGTHRFVEGKLESSN